jgi:hypothetical protein
MNLGKSFQILMAGSLLLNAFFVGFLLSHAMPGHNRPPMMDDRIPFGKHGGPGELEGGVPHHEPPGIVLEKQAKFLPEAYREKVQTIIRRHHDKVRSEMESLPVYFTDIQKILTAPKFDPDALKKAHEKLVPHEDAIKNDIAVMMEDIASILPDEERIRFFGDFLKDTQPPPLEEGKRDFCDPPPPPSVDN